MSTHADNGTRAETDHRQTTQRRSRRDAPKGDHSVATMQGYFYLDVRAGPKRISELHNEPQHEWLMRPV